jgi:hypothetical protein
MNNLRSLLAAQDPNAHMAARHIWQLFCTAIVTVFLGMLNRCERSQNDARWLREKHPDESLLAELVRQAAQRVRGDRAVGLG